MKQTLAILNNDAVNRPGAGWSGAGSRTPLPGCAESPRQRVGRCFFGSHACRAASCRWILAVGATGDMWKSCRRRGSVGAPTIEALRAAPPGMRWGVHVISRYLDTPRTAPRACARERVATVRQACNRHRNTDPSTPNRKWPTVRLPTALEHLALGVRLAGGDCHEAAWLTVSGHGTARRRPRRGSRRTRSGRCTLTALERRAPDSRSCRYRGLPAGCARESARAATRRH